MIVNKSLLRSEKSSIFNDALLTDNNGLQTEKMAIIRSVGKRDRSVLKCYTKFHHKNE